MKSSGYTNYSAVLIHSSLVDESAKPAISEVDDEILTCILLSQYIYQSVKGDQGSEMRKPRRTFIGSALSDVSIIQRFFFARVTAT